MVVFDDEKQKRKVDDLKAREEEELVQFLAQSKYNLPYIDLSSTTIETSALRHITEDEARKNSIAPFNILGTKIHIAVRSPETSEVKAFVDNLQNQGFTPILYMASKASLEKAWERFEDISRAEVQKSGGIDILPETIKDLREKIESIEDVKTLIEELKNEKQHKTSKILEIILAGAIELEASDIHIEPAEEDVRMRYRIDGNLEEIYRFPTNIFHSIDTRIKLLSGLKLMLRQVAQDGRFSIFLDDTGTEISIRTSIIPGAYGDTIVMRILDPKSIRVSLEDLGIPKNLYEIIIKEIKKPNGMIIITGPTGSGKTTTLYAFLSKIYDPEIKIITIEDPIEYHLQGITQTQTNSKQGYTFLEGLRSALRQDPDVIMVGEIRDSETANTATEAALTGHLVFSTLHTNNAAGAIPRLIDLEVNPKTIPSALTLALAQRLVRKVCADCSVSSNTTEEETRTINKVLQEIKDRGVDINTYDIEIKDTYGVKKGSGCKKCNGSGYKGRIGIFEAIKVNTKEIEDIIPTNPSEREILSASNTQGILRMKEDGIIKVVKGITTLEEVSEKVDLDE
ncbi:type II/IV secretion system protein [Candidatus Nomurabacteria bacterium]|nr:type II/IV secretion system protein [Candidatus Nomurabacteria bacterium]MCB9820460.1 type II/IV secretion system protein [Candidatus Nomurabacteria bacterium]